MREAEATLGCAPRWTPDDASVTDAKPNTPDNAHYFRSIILAYLLTPGCPASAARDGGGGVYDLSGTLPAVSSR